VGESGWPTIHKQVTKDISPEATFDRDLNGRRDLVMHLSGGVYPQKRSSMYNAMRGESVWCI
jgi:hypothetical protein